jgi:hypothetical protein
VPESIVWGTPSFPRHPMGFSTLLERPRPRTPPSEETVPSPRTPFMGGPPPSCHQENHVTTRNGYTTFLVVPSPLVGYKEARQNASRLSVFFFP